ncbi:Uma2 family endonuclease [Thiofilum flexile]|uniref:Uma2 family endonuclease n=1 Tax=Thiofilum flexile TaxID=125627 RepID=UPI00037CE5F5|nr:Uma2 family endonuclease [Thiofilum flexile]
MSALANNHYTTPEGYLLGENDRPDGIKYEYVNGQIYAMAGASRAHNIITGEMFALLRNHLKGSRCRAYLSDMKVGIQTSTENHFYYPDLQVSCQEENNRYFNTSPCLIIEVLSESTARIDRYEKLVAYKLIPTLQEYVLCAQDSPLVEIYRKSNHWQAEYFLTGQSFTLESIGLTLAVNDIYEFLITPPAHH